MFNFTHNNHFRYYIDNQLFGFRKHPEQEYRFEVGKVDLDHYSRSNYAEELNRVADLVHRDMGADKVTFLSGGLDSEIMVRSFVNIGIKPRCITIRFENDYNDYEVAAAEELTKSLGLTLEIIDFNIFDFYNSGEAIEIGKKYDLRIFPFAVFLKVIDKLSAPSVLACELQLNKQRDENDKPVWSVRALEDLDATYIRFSQDKNIPIVQEWFSYTPELMLYYLETPEVSWLANTPTYYQTILPLKNKIYKRLLPEVFVKHKNTGYDKLKGFFIESNRVMSDNVIKKVHGDPYISYNELIAMLRGWK